jgi:hypothetical protein
VNVIIDNSCISNNERLRNKEIGIYFRMRDAQAAEHTPTMLEFNGHLYHLPIEDEAYGFLTVAIIRKGTSIIQHRVRFKKVHKQGVVWTFGRKGASLDELLIEADLLPALEADAVANPPKYPWVKRKR